MYQYLLGFASGVAGAASQYKQDVEACGGG